MTVFSSFIFWQSISFISKLFHGLNLTRSSLGHRKGGNADFECQIALRYSKNLLVFIFLIIKEIQVDHKKVQIIEISKEGNKCFS